MGLPSQSITPSVCDALTTISLLVSLVLSHWLMVAESYALVLIFVLQRVANPFVLPIGFDLYHVWDEYFMHDHTNSALFALI